MVLLCLKRVRMEKKATWFPNTPAMTGFFLNFTFCLDNSDFSSPDIYSICRKWGPWESSRVAEGNYKSAQSKNRVSSIHIVSIFFNALLILQVFLYYYSGYRQWNTNDVAGFIWRRSTREHLCDTTLNGLERLIVILTVRKYAVE